MYKVDPALRLILASSSPRRRELLGSCVNPFEVLVSDVDETPIVGEQPEAMVVRLAKLKALAVIEKLASPGRCFVIGADTTVVCNGENLGKPNDVTDACRMLAILQGRDHQVWSAFAILDGSGVVCVSEKHCSTVRMRALDSEGIVRYVGTGEPCLLYTSPSPRD